MGDEGGKRKQWRIGRRKKNRTGQEFWFWILGGFLSQILSRRFSGSVVHWADGVLRIHKVLILLLNFL